MRPFRMTIRKQRPAARYTWAAGQPRAAVPTWSIFPALVEVKELSVPIAKADELKKFYRQIASDERNMVVLKADTK
jgi:hypothetical protein